MAAGLGFKDFVTGEVLTAADVDGYLMQGVWVFASAAARDAAVTSPQEGNFAYLKDTNVTTYYTGSAWANLDTTGMTNPMTTTGDIIYSSPGSTPVRLGIGTAGQILKVNSGATAPEWGAAGGASALTKITSAAFTNVSSVEIDNCFTATYTKYFLIWEATANSVQGIDLQLQFRYAGPTTQTSDYNGAAFAQSNGNTKTDYGFSGTNQATVWYDLRTGTQTSFGNAYFSQVGQSSQAPTYFGSGFGANSENIIFYNGYVGTARTYTGFLLKTSSSTMDGTYAIYGLAN